MFHPEVFIILSPLVKYQVLIILSLPCFLLTHLLLYHFNQSDCCVSLIIFFFHLIKFHYISQSFFSNHQSISISQYNYSMIHPPLIFKENEFSNTFVERSSPILLLLSFGDINSCQEVADFATA